MASGSHFRYSASMTNPKTHFGKYRGSVVNNVDPMRLGRIQVMVPDVGSFVPSTWAMPCFPVAGMFMVPPIGSGVWIEFERGDADYPIWTGCYYGSAAERPSLSQTAPQSVFSVTVETPGENGIIVSDMPGPAAGITIRHASGAMITIGNAGIVITNGQGAAIQLSGPEVSINDGALSIV